MRPAIVITAKANSERLPRKNMLPLGDMPLSVWSLREAKRLGVDAVVSTDIDDLKAISVRMGLKVVHQEPMESHRSVIEHAMKECGWSDRPCVLLQPTSPFRYGNIAGKCIDMFIRLGGKETVLTSSVAHEAVICSGRLTNEGRSVTLWDGCVAVYPAGRVCEYSPVHAVRNLHCNSLQIDTEEDYVQACLALEMHKEADEVLPRSLVNMLRPVLLGNGLGGHVTLVGRPDGMPIPQDRPAVYLNHCRGYEGGRCDALFVIANAAIRGAGINAELRECASKAGVVVVRSNGEIAWLLENLPEIRGKFYPIRDAIDGRDDHLTTGCIAAWLLNEVGARIEFRGMYSPSRIAEVLDPFHKPAMSREVSLLRLSGAF